MEAQGTEMRNNRKRYLFAGIILVMHVVFFAAALKNQSFLTDDSIQYLTIAENMATQGQFSQTYDGQLVADMQRTPGYPIFLMLLFRSPILILLVQHLLVLAAGGLIYLIIKDAHNARLGRIMAVIYLLQPYPKIFASMILSETLFIFLLLLGVFFFVRHWKGNGAWNLTLGLLALSFAAHVRPVALPLLIVGLGLTLVHLMVKRRQALQVGLACLIPLVLIGGWMMRNERLSGKWVFSSMGDMGMVHGRVGGLEAMRLGKGTHEHALFMAGDSIAAQEIGLGNIRSYPKIKQTHETESFAPGMKGLTFRFFFQHPIDALKFQFLSGLEMFKGVGFGWAKLLTKSKLIATISASLQFVLNLLVFLGFLMAMFRFRRWQLLERLSFGIILLVLLVSAAAWADGRYRVVIDPFFLVFLSFVLWNYEQHQNSAIPQRN